MLYDKYKKSGTRLMSILTIWLLVGVSLISVCNPIVSAGDEEINSETHDRDKVDTFQTSIYGVSGNGRNNTAPLANAGLDQNVKVNETVFFNGSKSYDPDNDNLSYKWDFGDGNSTGWQNSSQTSHLYNISYDSSGNDSATTIFCGPIGIGGPVILGNGSVLFNGPITIIGLVTVNGSLIVNGSINVNGTIIVNGPITIINNGTLTYLVNLTVSDGLLTDSDICRITISRFGINLAPVAIVGLDQNIKVNQTVNFDGNGSYDPDGAPLTFKWDFGDGTSTGWLISSKNSHIYNSPGNYTVTLTVSDGSLTDTDTCIVRVLGSGSNNTAPLANAGSDQYVKVNQTVNFDGSGSYDPDRDILTYKWDFGDGTTTNWLSSSKTSHSYKGPGNYTVILTVSDGSLTDSDICLIRVLGNGSNNTAPVANAGSDQYVMVNQTVNFDGSGSYDPDADSLSYKWDFGDSTSTGWLASSKNSHSYNKPGNYTVTLTVSDGLLTDTDTCVVRVLGSGSNNTAPVANAGSDQYFKVNQTVNFDGSGSYDPNADTLSYKWDFGDSTSTGWLISSKTSHSYNKPGNYTVTLTVSDGLLTDTDTCKICVSGTGNNNTAPVANAGPNQYAKVNQSVNFDGSKSYDPDADTLSYKWDFGDSTSTRWLTSSKTSHSYNSLGNYTVTLTVSDGSLTDTDSCIIYGTKQQQNSSSPKIISSNIQQNSQNIPINYSKIVIGFSTSMNHSSVESAISITPTISYTILWGNNETELQIIFTEKLSYNTAYKITIDTAAKDLEEKYLKDLFKLEFTTEIESQNGKNSDSINLENIGIYGLFIVIIIIIIITLALITRNKRKKQEKIDNEFSGRHEFQGGNLTEDFYFDEEFMKYSNEVIKELKKESLSFKKQSDFKLSNDKLLNKLDNQYEKGELSKTAYDSIKETLNKFD